MGDNQLSPRSRKPGGFKNFLASDKGVERNRKKEIANIKTSLERGSYLKEANTEVEGGNVEAKCIGAHAVTASMQGWRVSNEDSSVIRQIQTANGPALFIGTYDGHGGSEVARYLEEHLHNAVEALPSLSSDNLKQAFADTDAKLRIAAEDRTTTTGSTCSVVIIDATHIYCANTGDCRAVLCRASKAIPLSTDHSPEMEEETLRIEKSGSSLINGRIEGMLNVSRAFGDFEFKKASLSAEAQAITCICDVTVTERSSEDMFIVQACDGIWGSLDSDQAVAQVLSGGTSEADLLPNATALFNKILAEDSEALSGTDNMTMNIVAW